MAATLPKVGEVRERIERAGPSDIRLALMATHVLAGRVSEIVSRSSPHDNTVARGPSGADVRLERYQAGDFNEEVAVFNLRTAKRGGRERSVALPMSEEYEPWTKELYEYFKKRGDAHVFPFTRQHLGKEAKGPLVGLRYQILDYYLIKDKVKKKVEPHSRDFALHALRHLRVAELFDHYGFEPIEVMYYAGWTFGGMFGGGSIMERYAHLNWRQYFPKLLRRRI
mgnify:FL=1